MSCVLHKRGLVKYFHAKLYIFLYIYKKSPIFYSI